MVKNNFINFIQEQKQKGKTVYFDGGMGTLIQSMCTTKYNLPEDLNFLDEELILNIHRMYLEAGADIITANSFGANTFKCCQSDYTATEYIKKSIELAKKAILLYEKNHTDKKHFTAWDSGQIGKLLKPLGDLTFDEAYNSYKECAIAAEKSGADFALLETMSDLYEVKAAVLAIKENTCLPVVVSMTFQPNLRTLTGADVLTCTTYLEALGVCAIGFNCGGSLEEDIELAKQFSTYSSIPLLAQPNAGLPLVIEGKTTFPSSPEEFAQAVIKIKNLGFTMLGGCCGTNPSHIKKMKEACKNIEVHKETESQKNYSAVCSFNKTILSGGQYGPVIIGERINPTGKKKVKEALLNKDTQFFIEEASSQIEGGAHILDVNVGLPGIDEKQMMFTAISTIQSTFNTPLQIDSSDCATIEKALRYYNGKALVNSVNGKQEVMDKIFPLIKKYGGAVVGLTLDENGIPPLAEDRVKIAEKIINEAAKYGIKERNIFIDTLTLTVSSEQKTALETVKAINLLNEKHKAKGLGFILGVSNISFGLPRRELINSFFLQAALHAGLTACIINPNNAAMTQSFDSYRALAGYDKNCLSYIEKYTGTSSVQTVSLPGTNILTQKENTALSSKDDASSSLIYIIENGFKDKAASTTVELLKTKSAVEIIDTCIVPALDNVGKDFESGKKFLPQLLLSADTVASSFAEIKKHLAASGQKQESKGTIVMATVYGDIHDIGKNIVCSMLENYGYTVIDLGKNVPSQKIIDIVLKENIKLVGLSALMTTTVDSMENTIKELHQALKENKRQCKIMVGGAVLTEDYAKKINADYYTKDAMQSVAVAKKVFEK